MRRGWGSLARIAIAVACAACGGTTTPESPSAAAPSVEPSQAPASAEPTTPENAASVAPTPSEPRDLFGTWSTTLGGDPLRLTVSDTTYRIVRGQNVAEGAVEVAGDVIHFSDSTLCAGLGTYRWSIGDDGALGLTLQDEECPGRAEALRVRYPDYAPPSEGSAPPELAGLWSREYYAGEVLVMSLDGTRYTVSSGSSPVTGRIAVDGDRITFFDADVCDGEGSYTWTVDEAGLTLTPASDDPCGRAEFLPGVTWEAGP